jgi:hypothetical protein
MHAGEQMAQDQRRLPTISMQQNAATQDSPNMEHVAKLDDATTKETMCASSA